MHREVPAGDNYRHGAGQLDVQRVDDPVASPVHVPRGTHHVPITHQEGCTLREEDHKVMAIPEGARSRIRSQPSTYVHTCTRRKEDSSG